MVELTNMENGFFWIAAALVIIAIFVLLMMKFIVAVYFPFVDAYDRIYRKILFSDSYEKRQYWQYEKKRLYVSLIPLVGGFFASRMKFKAKKY